METVLLPEFSVNIKKIYIPPKTATMCYPFYGYKFVAMFSVKNQKFAEKLQPKLKCGTKKCCHFLAMMSAPRHASATFWRTLCRRVLASFAVPTFVRGARRCMIMQLRIHMTMALHISRATRWRHLCLRVRTSAYLYAPAWSHLCFSV